MPLYVTIQAWRISEPTIVTPMRIGWGLAALAGSPLHGNLEGHSNENAFARLLYESGVAHSSRLEEDKHADVSDLGRKWRAAMTQLGFVTNAPYEITPNGRRLIESMNLPPSTVLPAEQECFLRSLLAYQIPSLIETTESGPVFSPLRIVLEVLTALEKACMEASISKGEMAGIVQLVRRVEDVNTAVDAIGTLREMEAGKSMPKNRRRNPNQYLESLASSKSVEQTCMLEDYADSNFRYLKTTGLFSGSGGRLALALHKRIIVKQILSKPYVPIPNDEYLQTLWNGARLPTDDRLQAIEAVEWLISILRNEGEAITLPNLTRSSTEDL